MTHVEISMELSRNDVQSCMFYQLCFTNPGFSLFITYMLQNDTVPKVAKSFFRVTDNSAITTQTYDD